MRNLGCLVALAAALPAQNLVLNPGFESYATCPTASGQLAFAPPWYSPNGQTPDYLNACSSLTPSVPGNFYGNQAAHGGQAYASAIAYGQLPAEVREYCAGQLTSPLVAGRTYEVSFWVSLCDVSGYAIAELGAHLKVGPHSGSPSVPLPYAPQIQNPSSALLADKTGWTRISGTFVAAGGEDHIAVGNFNLNAATTAATAGGGTTQWAIYYIDDVAVVDTTTGGGCDVEVVGWADLPAPAGAGFLDSQDLSGCRPATTTCTTTTVVRAAAAYAGGTAYDPRHRSVWVSDGVSLAEHELAVARVCRQRCAPFRALLADPQAVVSGLACAEARPRLFQLATRPGYMEITVYDNSGPCPGRAVQCRRDLPPGAVAGGLAHDETEDLLYIAVSLPGNPGWANLLYVAAAADPCRSICETRLFTCSVELVTGLAFDACGRQLYATDGQITQSIDVADARRCQLRLGACCRKQHAPVYRGLATVPCWTSRKVGRSCTGAPCPSCAAMTIGSSGDPALGSVFRVTLDAAPAGATGYLVLSFGPCSAGLPLPRPWCGALYPSLLTAIVFAGVPVAGPPPCGGQAVLGLPLPVDPNLCRQTLCAQWLLLCPGLGLGQSDALEFTLTAG